MTCYCAVFGMGCGLPWRRLPAYARSPAIASASFASASALAIATQIDSAQEWDTPEAPAASGQSPPASPVAGNSSTNPPAPAPAAGQGIFESGAFSCEVIFGGYWQRCVCARAK